MGYISFGLSIGEVIKDAIILSGMDYDHARHAGNPGDLWKHFILLEVADFLLSKPGDWIYVETHAGAPDYSLKEDGQWKGGAGRCWPFGHLQTFPYFQILGSINTKELKLYPGSASLVLELAKRRGRKLFAELWDINPLLEKEWSNKDSQNEVRFHLADGFVGVSKLIEVFPSALLLIDPPYLDGDDVNKAEMLIDLAAEAGWVVLCWYMSDMKRIPRPICDPSVYELTFDDVGLDCGRWSCATVAVAGAKDELCRHLDNRTYEFLRIMT
jgi:23S rRNA (adenine2030-N6)-methyltransferase